VYICSEAEGGFRYLRISMAFQASGVSNGYDRWLAKIRLTQECDTHNGQFRSGGPLGVTLASDMALFASVKIRGAMATTTT
jgi:hypothetical protein